MPPQRFDALTEVLEALLLGIEHGLLPARHLTWRRLQGGNITIAMGLARVRCSAAAERTRPPRLLT
jgi:hypothetical protein